MRKIWLFLLVLSGVTAAAGIVEVEPSRAQILLPKGSPGIVQFAAKELQRHLTMMTSKEIPIVSRGTPGKYTFRFGKPDKVKLKSEEARWEVGKNETRIYGDSNVTAKKIYLKEILSHQVKTGDLSAVYAFLEEQLGFLFLAPGDMDTVFTPSPVLKLKEGNFSWDPGQLIQRRFRNDFNSFRNGIVKTMNKLPAFYQEKYKSDFARQDMETKLWLKKMRQGKSIIFAYGHAFTEWWGRYGKTNPEFFALVDGVRKPKGAPDRVKMCVSNPALVKKIVDLWKVRKPRPSFINVCENDSADFCECKECRKLDSPPAPGAKWDDNLTGRYIYFANAVAREARKIDPDVKISFYAYGPYRFPPEKFRVEPNIIIGFVPGMMGADVVPGQYAGWRKMGAKMMFQRPNDMHINTGLPMGFEKCMFELFQIGYRNGIFGTDYDSLHRFWDATGVADYILARAHVYPGRSFEEHFNEYCSAYGAAAGDVKRYFEYWRKEIFEKRLMKNRAEIREKGRYGNFRRGLMWDIAKYYFEKDFDITEKFLDEGAKRPLTPQQKARLEKLKRVHLHGRLTLRALTAKPAEKFSTGKALLKFRIDNWDKLNMSFFNLYHIEGQYGDVTNIQLATLLNAYKEGLPARFIWYFTIDPKQELLKNEVWKQPFKQIYKWGPVRLDAPWEQQSKKLKISPEMRETLKTYDGNAWYDTSLDVPARWKGKEEYVAFGAVDESAWIYLNGKLCGTRIFKDPDDWKKSFVIRIDQNIDWKKRSQQLLVRVEDKGGMGGIWRPVWIVCR